MLYFFSLSDCKRHNVIEASLEVIGGRTVAVPAAFRLRGRELVAEFAVSHRHGGASRAGAALHHRRQRQRQDLSTRAHEHGFALLGRSSGGGVTTATVPARLRPPRPIGGAHSHAIFSFRDSRLELPVRAPAQLRLYATPQAYTPGGKHVLPRMSLAHP